MPINAHEPSFEEICLEAGVDPKHNTEIGFTDAEMEQLTHARIRIMSGKRRVKRPPQDKATVEVNPPADNPQEMEG